MGTIAHRGVVEPQDQCESSGENSDSSASRARAQGSSMKSLGGKIGICRGRSKYESCTDSLVVAKRLKPTSSGACSSSSQEAGSALSAGYCCPADSKSVTAGGGDSAVCQTETENHDFWNSSTPPAAACLQATCSACLSVFSRDRNCCAQPLPASRCIRWPTLRLWIKQGLLHKLSRHQHIEQAYKRKMQQINDQYWSVDDYILHKVFQFPVRRGAGGEVGERTKKAISAVTGASSRSTRRISAEGTRAQSGRDDTSNGSMCDPANNYRSKGDGSEAAPQEKQKLWCYEQGSEHDKAELQVKIMPNDFPYAVEPSVRHFLLWSNQTLDRVTAERLVLERLPDIITKEGEKAEGGEATANTEMPQAAGAVESQDGNDAKRPSSGEGLELLLFTNPAHLKSVKGVHHWHVLWRIRPREEDDYCDEFV